MRWGSGKYVRIFRKTAIREASFLQTLSACALKESALSIFRPNLAIYLKTTCVALLCCKSHTHAANIKFQPNACSSCFKHYFPFLLPNPNPLLNPLPILVVLKILREKLLFTRSLMINTHPLVRCLENSDRKVKQFHVIPRIASSHLVYSLSIHWPNWMCLVLQRDSRFVSRNCHATHIALTKRLGSNGF